MSREDRGKVIGQCLMILSGFFSLCLGILVFTGKSFYFLGDILLFLLFIGLPLVMGSFLCARHEPLSQQKKIVKAALLIILLDYLFIAGSLLFGGTRAWGVWLPFKEYAAYHVNLTLFHTIRADLRGEHPDSYRNLIGNVLILCPLGILLPAVFPAFRSWKIFVPVALLIPALVELLQLLLQIGACDIDDVLLNSGGAILCYFLTKLPVFKRLLIKYC